MVWLRRAIPLLVALAVGACATVPDRVEYTEADQMAARVAGLPVNVRMYADAPLDEFQSRMDMAERRRSGRSRAPTFLALSGGADDGAYGAGFLAGWTARGNRPHFSIVSGVSTGALIAPYAFLGSDYDDELKAVFTEVDAGDIFRFRGLRGLFGTGLADTGPLREMVRRQVTPDLLRAIADESREGRVLLVATTNLDAQRSMIWDMGAIAEVGTERALEVFRDVLVASASVPALFPPVLFEAQAGERRFAELHVDGGTTVQVFTLPTSLMVSGARPVPRGARIYMIINNTLEPDFEVVRASTFPVASRSFSTLIKASTRQSVVSTYDFSRERNIGFQLTFIGDDFDVEYPGPFDRAYMNALYDYGLARGRDGVWRNTPPFLQ